MFWSTAICGPNGGTAFALHLPPMAGSTPPMGDRSRISRLNRSVAQTV
jgi:hypothetical protein